MLNENQITDLLAICLESNGYEVQEKRTTLQKGIDLILLADNGSKIFIEVKGETSCKVGSSRFNLPFNNKQINSHIGVALLATFKTMYNYSEFGNQFAMAFPFNHERVLLKIKLITDRLGITIYLVSENEVKIL